MHASSDILPVDAAVGKSDRSVRRVFPVEASRVGLAAGCAALIGLLGYLDYLTGYEQSLLLFYLVPIALATWFGGLVFGLIFSVLSVAVWVVSDLIAGIPTVVFGPGDIAQAHTADEWIELAQLDQAAEVLFRFATSF